MGATCIPPSRGTVLLSWSVKFLKSSVSFWRTMRRNWERASEPKFSRRAIRRTTSWLRFNRKYRQKLVTMMEMFRVWTCTLFELLLLNGCSKALLNKLGNAGWVMRGPKYSVKSCSCSLSFSLLKLLPLMEVETSLADPEKSTPARQQHRRCLSASLP